MFCMNCGKEMDAGAKFCTCCGQLFEISDKTPQDMILSGKSRDELDAEEMARDCLANRNPFSSNAKARILPGWKAQMKQYYAAMLDQMQDDEQCFLYFGGLHKYKSPLWHLGPYGYILTNKRLIMCGAFAKNADNFNYCAIMKELLCMKFACRVQSLYLEDIREIRENRVSGNEALTITTAFENFHVVIRRYGVAHELCKQIGAVLHTYRP